MRNKKEWKGGKVRCDLCNYEWIAVYHVNCKHLECPNCGNMVYYEEIYNEKMNELIYMIQLQMNEYIYGSEWLPIHINDDDE